MGSSGWRDDPDLFFQALRVIGCQHRFAGLSIFRFLLCTRLHSGENPTRLHEQIPENFLVVSKIKTAYGSIFF